MKQLTSVLETFGGLAISIALPVAVVYLTYVY